MKNYKHNTVLLNETINSLNVRSNGIYIDGTFGCGGHSRLILSRLGLEGRLLAIDRDPQAIIEAKTINDSRFSIIYGPFSALLDYITKLDLIGKINGIVLDLGISSSQLDNPDRGFSFMKDGPLDMRMDSTCGQSAAKLLRAANENSIARVLRKFGEERFSKRIARAIVERNRVEPITSTKELAELISLAIPMRNRRKHPATRTFQAIRIWVNNELKEIELVLKGSVKALAPGGRLSIISFHSLEDRIVKRFMYDQSHGPQIPNGLPITKEQLKKMDNCQLLTISKLMPDKKEIIKNPRARSAILRTAEKIKL